MSISMKILNDIACNLNSMQIEFTFNSIQFTNWIKFKYVEWNFNSLKLDLNSIELISNST